MAYVTSRYYIIHFTVNYKNGLGQKKALRINQDSNLSIFQMKSGICHTVIYIVYFELF